MNANQRGDAALESQQRRLAWIFVLPAVALIALVALFPLVWAVWESLHRHVLSMPWLGEPFVGLANYRDALSNSRFWQAMGHTAFFTAVSVALELVLGLVLATALNRAFYGRGLVRTLVLLPWATPTVVAALVWRFMFDSQTGIANPVLAAFHVADPSFVWFAHGWAAWVPIILADVWKTTPFTTLLLLAGLQNIDRSLYEAAAIDGAGPWQRFVHVTLPMLRPALLVALVFRTLDAFRVFDLIWVMTQGGPGTSTEPISLYAFDTLMNNLRFGFGSALAVTVFVVTFVLAMVYLRLLGKGLVRE